MSHVRILTLTNGASAIVNAELPSSIWNRIWSAHVNGYAYAFSRGKTLHLHRCAWEFFNGPIPEGHVVHHVNGSKLDCRIENLELLTSSEHTRHHCLTRGPKGKDRSTNPFKGVRLAGKRWAAKIAGRHLGMFDTAEEAAARYNLEALIQFGPGCFLNPLPDQKAAA